MFYIGGFAKGSNIEVHDMRFCVGAKPEDCYDDLRAAWWGIPSTLHLDCWGEVTHADGYDIALSNDPVNQSEKLYFVNLGGYDPAAFSELHKNIFVVAPTESKAKAKALRTVIGDWQAPHKDNVMEVEKALCLSDALAAQGRHIHLTPNEAGQLFRFICKYKPIANAL